MFLNVIHPRLLATIMLMSLSFMAHASLEAAIEDLLNRADADVKANRLMTPTNNNAYDRYQAVLLLDKGNQRASEGIRAIAERYRILARAKLSQKNFSGARVLLKKAVTVDGQTAVNTRLAKVIRQSENDYQRALLAAQQVQPTEAPESDLAQRVFKLNPNDLSQRNSQMVAELKSLGQRVQGTKEYVMIYARNDAEGRWIYQQMRKASNGYRLRGNIKHHRKPRVVLEKPLD